MTGSSLLNFVTKVSIQPIAVPHHNRVLERLRECFASMIAFDFSAGSLRSRRIADTLVSGTGMQLAK